MERLMVATKRDNKRRNGCRDISSNPPKDPYSGYILGQKVDLSITTE